MLARAALILTIATAAACTGHQRPVSVTLENQSSIPLEVEVDLPARGPFGRKPNHEAYRLLLPAGEKWQNSPDTLRFAADPNPAQGFRIWAADNSQTERIWYNAFTVEGSRKQCHVIFRGVPGALVWAEPKGGEHAMEIYK